LPFQGWCKMNIICQLIGHSFISRIYDGKYDPIDYTVTSFKFAFCKRCGVTLENCNKSRSKEKKK